MINTVDEIKKDDRLSPLPEIFSLQGKMFKLFIISILSI